MDNIVSISFLISIVFFSGLLVYLVKALRDSYKKPKSKYEVWAGWLDRDEIELLESEAEAAESRARAEEYYMRGWNRGLKDAQRRLDETGGDDE